LPASDISEGEVSNAEMFAQIMTSLKALPETVTKGVVKEVKAIMERPEGEEESPILVMGNSLNEIKILLKDNPKTLEKILDTQKEQLAEIVKLRQDLISSGSIVELQSDSSKSP
jgi:hypothetical protein